MATIGWEENEDQLLIQTVLGYCQRGAGIAEAFKSVAKQISRTTDACSGRWYEKFHSLYEKQLNSIRNVVKRTNDFKGRFEQYEEEKFLNLMVECKIKDMSTNASYEYCADKLGRSAASCRNFWEKHFIKKNQLTFENLVEKGKQEMATIARNWGQDKEHIVATMMKNFISQGIVMEKAFVRVGERIKENKTRVRDYWYVHLYPEHKEEVAALRPTRQNVAWSEDEQYRLFKIVFADLNKEKIGQLLKTASEKLNRPLNECINQWYNKVRKNREYVSRFADEQRQQKQATEVGKPSENLTHWTDNEKELLKNMVLKTVEAGSPLMKAFKEVSQKTGRTMKAVEVFYSKNTKYEIANELKKIHEGNKNKAGVTEVKETPVDPTPTLQESIQTFEKEIRQGEREKIQTQAAFPQLDELMVMVQKLVNRNKELEQENQDLRSELNTMTAEAAMANEFKKNYEEVLSAVERARRFIVDAEVGFSTKISK